MLGNQRLSARFSQCFTKSRGEERLALPAGNIYHKILYKILCKLYKIALAKNPGNCYHKSKLKKKGGGKNDDAEEVRV